VHALSYGVLLMSSIQFPASGTGLPEYTSRAAHQVRSVALGDALDGRVPCQSVTNRSAISETANDALHNAKDLLVGAAPLLTAASLSAAFTPRWGGDYDFSGIFRLFGFLSLPAAVVVDALKAPLCLAGATEEALRGGITKLVAGIANDGERRATAAIYESFQKRFMQTLYVQVKMGLETPESLQERFARADIDSSMALTLLLTAFASRSSRPGSIALASGRRLERAQCPAQGKALFDLVDHLRQQLVAAGLPTRSFSRNAAAEQIAKWLPPIKAVLERPGTFVDTEALNMSPEHVAQFNDVVKTLKDIQAEIGRMPLARRRQSELATAPRQLEALSTPPGR
jgi:hypothetical protein